jgi:hypothetical protein
MQTFQKCHLNTGLHKTRFIRSDILDRMQECRDVIQYLRITERDRLP